MKSQLPKGLIVMSLLTIVASLFSMRFVLRPDGQMIFAGQILHGLPFKVYYFAVSVISISFGIGLLFRQRWAYFCFMTFSAYSAFLAISNIIFTDKATLVRIGWKLADHTLRNFWIIQAGVLLLVVLLVLWIYRYRGEFRRDSAKQSVQQTG